MDDPTIVAASACFGWLEEVVSDAHRAADTWDELEVTAKDAAEQRGDQRLAEAVDVLRRAAPDEDVVPAVSGDALTSACEAAYGVQLDQPVADSTVTRRMLRQLEYGETQVTQQADVAADVLRDVRGLVRVWAGAVADAVRWSRRRRHRRAVTQVLLTRPIE